MLVMTGLASNALVAQVINADAGKEHLLPVACIEGGREEAILKEKGLLLAVGMNILTEGPLAVVVLEIMAEHLLHETISVLRVIYRLNML